MDCRTFRDQIAHFQSDEVDEAARRLLQQHLDACPECARRLEFEDAMLDALRRRLPRVPAPTGLDARIRSSLAAEPLLADEPSFGAPVALYRRPWVAAAAAVVLLALVVVPRMFGTARESAGRSIRVVEQAVLVVDADCERRGRTLEQQMGCRHPEHFNRLKLADGEYWNVSMDDDAGRRIVLAPDLRGRRLLVDGDLYPEIRTLRLRRFEVLESARLRLPRALSTRPEFARATGVS